MLVNELYEYQNARRNDKKILRIKCSKLQLYVSLSVTVKLVLSS